MFMMLLLTLFSDIPQLNVGLCFSAQQDDDIVEPHTEPERVHFASGYLGPTYNQHINQKDMEDKVHYVRRASSRPPDSPSPDEDEDLTPIHARQ